MMSHGKLLACLAISVAAAFSCAAFAVEGKVIKLDLKPGKERTTLMINYSGVGKFRLFQSEKSRSVIIEAESLSFPPTLTKMIDASASGGPVLQLTPYNASNGGRSMAKLVIQLRGQADVNSNDSPGVFQVDIVKKHEFLPTANIARDNLSGRMAAAQKSENGEDVARKLIEVLNTAQDEKKYFGSKVTFEAKDAEVPDIFRLVGESSNLNIVWDPEVASAKTSLSVKDLPWDQLLDIVVQQKNYKAIVMGNVVRIMTLETFNLQAKARKEELSLSEELEPVVMAVIPLSFIDADDMKKMITELIQDKSASTGDVASETTAAGGATTKNYDKKLQQDFKRGRIEVDKRTNSIVVTNTKDSIERMRRLIKELDVAVPQILIDAKIIIASENFAKQLGVRWQQHVRGESGSSGIAGVFGGGTDAIGGGPTALDAVNSLALSGSAGSGDFGVGFGANERANLKAALRLSEINSTSKTVASPRVIVNNNTVAEINDTTTVSQLVAGGAEGSSSGTTNTAGLKLSLTPQVTSHGSVKLKALTIDRGALIGSTLTTTTIANKNLKTEVLVDSGATLVLGGIYQFDSISTEQGIPLLKDLPFIGGLFRTKSDSNSKSELMVFITPQIIDPQEASQAL